MRVLEPSDLFVMVPEPNFWVWPVTVFPSRPLSVVRDPEPKGRDSVVEPSDHLVIVPEPNFCVWPVIVLPSRVLSVVSEPEPKGRVWLLVPSDLCVSVPEPNFWVWPVRGWLRLDRGGVGSPASTAALKSRTPSMKTSTGGNRVGRFIAIGSEGEDGGPGGFILIKVGFPGLVNFLRHRGSKLSEKTGGKMTLFG